MKHNYTMIKLMFVCLGNICRSPLAEAVLKNKVLRANLKDSIYIESSGTAAYHIGENPDPRTTIVAQKHQVPISHKAQQLNNVHFTTFDYIVVMDDSNRKNVVRIKPTHAVSAFFKLRDFDTQDEGSDVIDPWFGDEDGFEECYQTIDRCTDELLLFLMNKHHLAKG